MNKQQIRMAALHEAVKLAPHMTGPMVPTVEDTINIADQFFAWLVGESPP